MLTIVSRLVVGPAICEIIPTSALISVSLKNPVFIINAKIAKSICLVVVREADFSLFEVMAVLTISNYKLIA